MSRLNSPDQSKAWTELEKASAHFKKGDFKLTDLFKKPDRFSCLSITHEKLTLDFSKNLLDERTIQFLLQLANDMQLSESIDSMFKGESINTSEHRPALHTALRIPKRENPHHEVIDCLNRMEGAVDDILSGKWTGYSGHKIRDIVNIGIGGSDLGPSLVCDALANFKINDLNIHFVSNLDPLHLDDILEGINPETTLFIVASKSFTTLETQQNASFAKQWLFTSSRSKEVVKNHFIAITSNLEHASSFGIPKENIFPMWDWVGGRYSLWSAIGLPIALSVGMKNFTDLLAGAHSMDEHFKKADLSKNMPVMMALITVWYSGFFNCTSNAIVPYSHRLRKLPTYLQQLCMESLGKSVSREGDPVSTKTGEVIWGTAGTNSQHSYFQLLHQGTQFVPIDFIAVAKTVSKSSDHKERHNHLLANCLSQSLALMNGKSEPQNKHKDMAGNKPSNTLLIEELNPFTLGSIIALYEHKTFAQSILWNINAFDQWGVELGKILSKTLYEELTSSSVSDNLDSSTKNLIELIKK